MSENLAVVLNCLFITISTAASSATAVVVVLSVTSGCALMGSGRLVVLLNFAVEWNCRSTIISTQAASAIAVVVFSVAMV